LISPTPIVGPDHLWKEETSDNHVASRRSYEGNLLRRFLGAQKDMVVVCGDRHWQYVSEDPATGLREYSCGPTTDQHATELKNEDHRMIRFLRAKGGFLSVAIDRVNRTPTAIFRHHNVEGKVVNEDVRQAKK
ncbi:alkaline phosphatase, partial [Acidobacteria bacterium AH-259-A15]|nr:alkaline phosphatase [Acidobacteria bacterium AH-259-A15]